MPLLVPATQATASPELTAFVVYAVLVVLFVAVSRTLGRYWVTAPIVFVAAGALLGLFLPTAAERHWAGIKALAEVTLVLLLFHDAAQVRPRQIQRERGPVARLLLIGLPLTILLGYLAARWLLPDVPAMFALLLAATLAPTDAGLGAATVLNPIVPVRIRRLLNVESGLNDGLATPVVMFAITAIAGSEGLRVGQSVAAALLSLAVGLAIGVAIGVVGALVLGASQRGSTSTRDGRALAVLLLPLLSYVLAALVGGNGFVAAFVAGTAFAGAASWLTEESSALHLTEALADPLGYAVWLLFGFVGLSGVWGYLGLREVAFAALALTILRMGPVALSLIGSGLRWQSVAFVGWFGPRGLASVVFALIAVETLDPDPALHSVVATVALTVLGSVVLHGLTSQPLSERFGAWVDRVQPAAELADAPQPRSRNGRLEVSSRRRSSGG